MEIIKNKISRENLNIIQKEIYDTAVSHGWHEKEYSTGHYRAMIFTEMAEAIEADRKGCFGSTTKFRDRLINTNDFEIAFDQSIRYTVQEEIADVIIRILDFSEASEKKPQINFTADPDNIELFRNMELTEFIDLLISHLYFERNTYDKILTYIVQWAESKDINIWDFVYLKMVYNKSREYKHGGKKY